MSGGCGRWETLEALRCQASPHGCVAAKPAKQHRIRAGGKRRVVELRENGNSIWKYDLSLSASEERLMVALAPRSRERSELGKPVVHRNHLTGKGPRPRAEGLGLNGEGFGSGFGCITTT